MDFKSQMIAQKRAQKAKRHENKKLAKVESKNAEGDGEKKPSDESEAKPEKVHFKKSMLKKTRSK